MEDLFWENDMTEMMEKFKEAFDKASVTDLVGILRGWGWTVAVHNDYALKDQPMTFWLFTHQKKGRYVKGEGASDLIALRECYRAADQIRETRLSDLPQSNDRPWPIRDVIAKLANAAGHLLKDHSCDGHGYEEIDHARNAAMAFLQDEYDELERAAGAKGHCDVHNKVYRGAHCPECPSGPPGTATCDGRGRIRFVLPDGRKATEKCPHCQSLGQVPEHVLAKPVGDPLPSFDKTDNPGDWSHAQKEAVHTAVRNAVDRHDHGKPVFIVPSATNALKISRAVLNALKSVTPGMKPVRLSGLCMLGLSDHYTPKGMKCSNPTATADAQGYFLCDSCKQLMSGPANV